MRERSVAGHNNRLLLRHDFRSPSSMAPFRLLAPLRYVLPSICLIGLAHPASGQDHSWNLRFKQSFYTYTAGDDVAMPGSIGQDKPDPPFNRAHFSPGEYIGLWVSGDIRFSGGNAPEQAFVASAIFAEKAELRRRTASGVEGRFGGNRTFLVESLAASPVASGGSGTVELSHDFHIGPSTATGPTRIVKVPQGANFLYVTVGDSNYSDNSDPDGDADLHLVRNPPRPRLHFSAASYQFAEGHASPSITIVRDQGVGVSCKGSLSVNAGGGTATAGAGGDYLATTVPVVFAAGDTQKSVPISIVNDSTFENAETFTVTLSVNPSDNPNEAYLNGANPIEKTVAVTIVDDDPPPTPSIEFRAPGSSVGEPEDGVNLERIDLELSEASPLAVSVWVEIDLEASTAENVGDYTWTSGAVNFPPGSTTAWFEVQINSDEIAEGRERLVFLLGEPTNATRDSAARYTLEIVDGGLLPAVSFVESTSAYDEGFDSERRPLVHLDFDNDTLDQSGNGHHGTLVNGAHLVPDSPAQLGRGQSLEIANTGEVENLGVTVELPARVGVPFTVTHWVSPATPNIGSVYKRLFGFENSAFEVGVSNLSGAIPDLTLHYYNGTWHNTDIQLPQNRWSHLAWVNTGSVLLMYLDGRLSYVGDGGLRDTLGNMFIGRARHTLTFEGRIDDFRFYEGALQGDAIAALSASDPYPVLHLPFDGDANDASGNGRDGLLENGAAFWGDIPDHLGNGQSLAVANSGGIENQAVVVPGSIVSVPFTLSYWLRPRSLNVGNSGHEGLTGFGFFGFETAIGDQTLFGTASGVADLTLSYYQGAWHDTGVQVPLNQWTHLTWVNTGSVVKLFLNGNLVFQGPGGVRGGNLDTLYVGLDKNRARGFDGNIDDLKIFDRALDTEQVRTLVPAVPEPLVQFEFEGDADDSSSHRNHGVAMNAVGFSSQDPFDSAASRSLFLDNRDGVESAGVRVETPVIGSPFTLAYWANPATLNRGNGGFERLSAFEGFAFETAIGDQSIHAATDDLTLSYFPGQSWVNTGVRLAENTWSHLAWVHRGDSVALFVDGVPRFTGRGGIHGASLGTLFVGTDHTLQAGFEGYMDDFRFYGMPLEEQQIANLVNEDPTLFLHLDFDENIADRSGNGRDGELRGGADYSSDSPQVLATGGSLSLANRNGVENQGVSAQTQRLDEPFTIAHWVKPTSANVGDDAVDYQRLLSFEEGAFEVGVGTREGTDPDLTLHYYTGTWHSTDIQLAPDVWSHLTWVNTGTSVALYVNGESAYSGPGGTNGPTTRVYVGRDWGGQQSFEGLIDDFRIYAGVVAPSEIVMLVAGDAPEEIPHSTIELLLLLDGSSGLDATIPLSYSGALERGVDFDAPDSITIPAGQNFGVVEVTLYDDADLELLERLTVMIDEPLNARRGEIISHSISITDDDISPPDRVTPTGSKPEGGGSIQVDVDPPFQVGVWRLSGESVWRSSGELVSALAQGDHHLEFRPIDGYGTPLPRTETIAAGEALAITVSYDFGAPQQVGDVAMTLTPEIVASVEAFGADRAQWKLEGESAWRDSGDVASDVPVGEHRLLFKPVQGYMMPPVQTVVVSPDSTAQKLGLYREDPTPDVPRPEVATDEETDNPPLEYIGIVRSEVGLSSGFAIREQVVFTVAHALFDDLELVHANDVSWFHQRQPDYYVPERLVPRGWIMHAGYAQQREDDILLRDTPPGISTPESQGMDVAAMFFCEPVARGGQGGFLVSDESPSEWIASTHDKMLVGYPVDGVLPSNRGRMHASIPLPLSFLPLHADIDSVYWTSHVRGYRGISGGPLYLRTEDSGWLPFAIYLGGTRTAIVRVIDHDAAAIISRAVIESKCDGNGTGDDGRVLPGRTVDEFTAGRVLVATNIPSGRWRLGDNGPGRSWLGSGGSISLRDGREVVVEFRTVPGWDSPDPIAVTAIAGQVNSYSGTYTKSYTSWVNDGRLPPEAFANPEALEPLADFDGDGLPNLLEWAFGLDLLSPDANEQTSADRFGLPRVYVAEGQQLRVEYIRRRGSVAPGLRYAAEFSSNLDWGGDDSGTVVLIDPIDDEWERVIVDDLVSTEDVGQRFARVRVEYE